MPNIKEIIIDSWSEFDRIVKRREYRRWIYRGQTNSSWKLESSLYRTFNTVQTLHKYRRGKSKRLNKYEHERVMINRFKTNAHLYLDHLPQDGDDFSWLALMQHYGAPSRLMDFTFSPFIAAYFALEDGEEDASIYAMEHSILREADQELFGDDVDLNKIYDITLKEKADNYDPFIYVFEPKFSNERIMAQQGVFLVPSAVDISHQDLLEEYVISQHRLIKYIIPKDLRASGIEHLNQMNITANIIYPGLEGFCKSMKYQPLFGLGYTRQLNNL